MEKELVKKPYDWDRMCMEMAFVVSRMSKDPSTQVGAVLVSPDRTRISAGYNGFPCLVPDYREWWENRDPRVGMCKYDVVRHAEKNAITQAKTALDGWTMYVTHHPCISCTVDIVAERIGRVFYVIGQGRVNMELDEGKVLRLFSEARVEIIRMEGFEDV